MDDAATITSALRMQDLTNKFGVEINKGEESEGDNIAEWERNLDH